VTAFKSGPDQMEHFSPPLVTHNAQNFDVANDLRFIFMLQV
jgi:hypothetical protein